MSAARSLRSLESTRERENKTNAHGFEDGWHEVDRERRLNVLDEAMEKVEGSMPDGCTLVVDSPEEGAKSSTRELNVSIEIGHHVEHRYIPGIQEGTKRRLNTIRPRSEEVDVPRCALEELQCHARMWVARDPALDGQDEELALDRQRQRGVVNVGFRDGG
jgi:hypothetical protein